MGICSSDVSLKSSNSCLPSQLDILEPLETVSIYDTHAVNPLYVKVMAMRTRRIGQEEREAAIVEVKSYVQAF